jgi:hypothetical protein
VVLLLYKDGAIAHFRTSRFRSGANGRRLCTIACPDLVPDSYGATVGIRAARDAIRSAPGGSVRVQLRLCRIRTRRGIPARRSERPPEGLA